jgi:hypothetical protein
MADPIEEWQRLTRLYSEMGEIELRELADGFRDLTEIAQQVLRDEMKKRGLGEPRIAAVPAPKTLTVGEWDGSHDRWEQSEESSLPGEYTHKVVLCESDDQNEIWQVSEVLRRAGIESWTTEPRGGESLNLTHPRVLVAADDLEAAIQIVQRGIPSDVRELSTAPVEDFTPPSCPRCGAPDPLLESVDPCNTWSCEVCGAGWSDPSSVLDESPQKSVG